MDLAALPRRQLARGLALAVVLALLAPAGASAVTYDPSEATEFQRGTVTEPAEGLTVVAIQGFHFRGQGATKKPARLAAFGPRGELRWVYNGSDVGARWFYDVDPLPDGNLLVTATNPDGTVVIALDPRTREPVWVERLPYIDTHDVDLLPDGRLLVGRMRGYDEATGRNEDAVVVYNRTTDEVDWAFRFADHYPRSGGGAFTDDWTHVNDVDRVGPGRYLVSVRNFDQVLLLDRETDSVVWALGSDEDHGVLHEQHNPVLVGSDAGSPTVLVADSENARVVEYARRGGEWEPTWTLTGSFAWPRDADRLPDGNTLVVDSLNHRVVEVTPEGEVVWEVYAPWGPYDAERVPLGDEAGGPTMAEHGAPATATLHGSAGLTAGTGERLSFAQRLTATFAGTPLEAPATRFAQRWAHVTPWIYPVWMTGWDFAFLVAALLVVVGWAAAEAVLARDRLAARVRELAG